MEQKLRIGPGIVVSAEFWIYDTDGNELDSSDGPISYLHGGHDVVFERIDEALLGQAAGFEQIYHLEPHDAFGDYDAELLRVEPRSRFPEPLEVGMQFEGVPSDESEADSDDASEGASEAARDAVHDADDEDRAPLIFVVRELADDKVILDANHPWAGQALRVKVRIVKLRHAEPEEIEMGFAADDDDDEEEQLDAMIARREQGGMLH